MTPLPPPGVVDTRFRVLRRRRRASLLKNFFPTLPGGLKHEDSRDSPLTPLMAAPATASGTAVSDG